MAGLSSSWKALPPSVRDVDPVDLANMALSQVHNGQRLQAAIMLQDMYRSQAILEHQDRTLHRVENLIRRIRSVADMRERSPAVPDVGPSK